MVLLTSILIRGWTPIFDFNVSNVRVHVVDGSETPTTRSFRTPVHWRNRRTDMRAIPMIHAPPTIEVDLRSSPAAPVSMSRNRSDISTAGRAASAVQATAAPVWSVVGTPLVDARNAKVEPVPIRSAITPPTAQAYLVRGSAAGLERSQTKTTAPIRAPIQSM